MKRSQSNRAEVRSAIAGRGRRLPGKREPRRQTLHEQLICKLAAHDERIKRTGFRRTIKEISPYAAEIDEDGLNFYDDEVGGVVPDAFFVDQKNRLVYLFEVVVTHGLDHNKLCSYSNLFWIIDEDYWQTCVVIIDRFGMASFIDTYELVVMNDVDVDKMKSLGPTFNVHERGGFSAWQAQIQKNIDGGKPKTAKDTSQLAIDFKKTGT